jgi:hypothetical protein
MTGGLMQLVANGAQDVYLTGNPTITHFKTVYRRHTNFSIESIEQIFDSKVAFGNRVNCTISRNGDLIHEIYLVATLPDIPNPAEGGNYLRWTDNIGHYMISSVDIEIGGQLMDRHYGDWLEIWSQLTLPAGQKENYLTMIGQDRRNIDGTPSGLQASAAIGRTIYIPLQFWFCRNVGLALPLVSLQHHEVTIGVQISTLDSLIFNTDAQGTILPNPVLPVDNLRLSLWVDYIYLDTAERWRFAQVAHEYLIEQLQYTSSELFAGTLERNIPIEFNHPVKEIFWVARNKTMNAAKQWNNYTDTCASTVPNTPVYMTNPHGGLNPVSEAKISFNGLERFAKRDGDYFNWVQPKNGHTNIPESKGINVYSFALEPENHQPTGTCNFSRIDTALLTLKLRLKNTGTKTAYMAMVQNLQGLSSTFDQAYVQALITIINNRPSQLPGPALPVTFSTGEFISIAELQAFVAWLNIAKANVVAYSVFPDTEASDRLFALEAYMSAVITSDFFLKTVKYFLPSTELTSEAYTFPYADIIPDINKFNEIEQPTYILTANQLVLKAYTLISDSGSLPAILDAFKGTTALLKTVTVDKDLTSYIDYLPIAGWTVLKTNLDQIRNFVQYTEELLADNLWYTLKQDLSGENNVVHIYALNYNILRIKSGMGGLAYSN